MLNKVLRDSALLGTERRRINNEELHPAIAQRVAQIDNEEEKLLSALSYESMRQSLGREPQKMNLVDLAAPIIETKSYIPKGTSSLIMDILDEKQYILTPMIIQILEFVISKNQILRPEATLKVLDTAIIKDKKIQSLIRKVIGERGEKIMQLFNPVRLSDMPAEADWETASGAQRQLLFKKWRESDARDGLSELSADWDSENVRSQLAFLKTIASTLREADGDFLAQLHEGYKGKSIKRKTDKQCKRILIACLTRLDRVNLLSELEVKLGTYLKSKKGLKLLSGRAKREFKPLKKEDDFWNGTHLSKWMGLSESNLDLGRFDYDPLYWLSEMMEMLPFSFWMNLLQQNAKDTVDYLLTAKQFRVTLADEEESILLPALVLNALSTRDTVLLDALSHSTYQSPDSDPLLPLFSEDQFEIYVKKNKLWGELPLLTSRLRDQTSTWTSEFSKQFMSELQNEIKSGACYPDVSFGALLTKVLHPASMQYLQKLNKKSQGEPWHYLWDGSIIQPITRKMNLTIRFNKLKKEEYEQS